MLWSAGWICWLEVVFITLFKTWFRNESVTWLSRFSSSENDKNCSACQDEQLELWMHQGSSSCWCWQYRSQTLDLSVVDRIWQPSMVPAQVSDGVEGYQLLGCQQGLYPHQGWISSFPPGLVCCRLKLAVWPAWFSKHAENGWCYGGTLMELDGCVRVDRSARQPQWQMISLGRSCAPQNRNWGTNLGKEQKVAH